jgi:hypothetical protein
MLVYISTSPGGHGEEPEIVLCTAGADEVYEYVVWDVEEEQINASYTGYEEEHINASYTDGQQSQDRTK